MQRLFIPCFLLIAVAALFSAPAYGDSGPSLSATQNFLLDYLPRRFLTDNKIATVLQDGSWSFDGCKLHFSEKTTFVNHPTYETYVPKTVYDVDIYPSKGEFAFDGGNSPNDAKLIWFTSSSTANFGNVAIGRISVVQDEETGVADFGGRLMWAIPFNDQKTADRVSHALHHLATLCGVAPEPF